MMRKVLYLLIPIALFALLTACTVQYKFTGTSINYDLIKTIQIDKIVNRAPYGWAPMEAMRNGDIHLAGEIVSYDQFNKGISADGYASQVQLRITVNIRFVNSKTNQQWEKQFSATSQYDSTQQLTAVQESLVTEMINDLCDQIFNATVADW